MLNIDSYSAGMIALCANIHLQHMTAIRRPAEPVTGDHRPFKRLLLCEFPYAYNVRVRMRRTLIRGNRCEEGSFYGGS